MNFDELDRILSRENQIEPSSRFADSVMTRVKTEAAIPPPIPFPWPRAIPGIVCWVVLLGLTMIRYQPAQTAEPIVSKLVSTLVTLTELLEPLGLGWIALVLLTIYASTRVSFYVVHRR